MVFKNSYHLVFSVTFRFLSVYFAKQNGCYNAIVKFLLCFFLTLLDGSDAEVPALDKVYYSILEKKFDALAERVGILENTVQEQNSIISSQMNISHL